jgi:dinuclear metal center YbgI/SA1388 family protein
MRLADVIFELELLAPPRLQESYDNAGLITGSPDWEFKGSLSTLDSTEAIIDEAIARDVNLVVAHHPIVFKGLKRLNGNNYIERCIIKAIKHDIAIYAIHTNLDNVRGGVNDRIADTLGLSKSGRTVLMPKPNQLHKLETYVPNSHMDSLRKALWEAGAGQIGNYGNCSFRVGGHGTFEPMTGAQPFSGTLHQLSDEAEIKLELIYPSHSQSQVLKALMKAHPYEQVAYQSISLNNTHQGIGAGLVGELPKPVNAKEFLSSLKGLMKCGVVKHTNLCYDNISRVALMGGSGVFGLSAAKASGAQVYITSDVKYHEFFDADEDIILVDIGHYESEQYTQELLQVFLAEKFPSFANLLSGVSTNPVNYL